MDARLTIFHRPTHFRWVLHRKDRYRVPLRVLITRLKTLNRERTSRPRPASVFPLRLRRERETNPRLFTQFPAKLVRGTKTAELYGVTNVVERHRHRYEVNQKFMKQIYKGGLVISGTSPDGELVEFVEAPECNYFVATQAHPEFKSRPLAVHPMFYHFMKAVARATKKD